MPTLRVWDGFEVEIGGRKISGGSRVTPIELTVSTPYLDTTKLLTAGSSWTPWGAQTPDPISDFDFLYIESDVSGVQLELTIDVNNGVGDELICITLQAGKPFKLYTDDAYALYTANFVAGTLDVIDRIRLKNPSAATSSANVRVVLFT